MRGSYYCKSYFSCHLQLTHTVLQTYYFVNERVRWIAHEFVPVAQAMELVLQQPAWRQAWAAERNSGDYDAVLIAPTNSHINLEYRFVGGVSLRSIPFRRYRSS